MDVNPALSLAARADGTRTRHLFVLAHGDRGSSDDWLAVHLFLKVNFPEDVLVVRTTALGIREVLIALFSFGPGAMKAGQQTALILQESG